MSLSIIIPCRNEEENIKKILLEIKKKISKEIKNYKIIIINDYSTDNTFEISKKLSKNNYKIIVKNNLRKGLGGAINYGIKLSKKKYVTIMMADLSDSCDDLKKYYKIISEERVDGVFGSRFIDKSKIIDYPFKNYIFNRIFNNIVKII